MGVDLPADLVHVGVPLLGAKRVVVAVHGRDQDADYMVTHLVDRLQLDGIAFLLPVASARRWYPAAFLAPLELNAAELAVSLRRLDDLQTWLTRMDIAHRNVVWCGFSQGASLVTTYVARCGVPRGALVALTGALIGPPGTSFHIDGDLEGMPVYLTASSADDWLPVDRALDTASVFRAAGAQVHLEVFSDRGHVISDAEIAATRELIIA